MRSMLAATALLFLFGATAHGQDSVAPPPPPPPMSAAPSDLVVPAPSTPVRARPPALTPAAPPPMASVVEVDKLPVLDSVQAWYYPRGQLGKQVRVVFKAIIDSTGRVLPASIQLMSLSDPAFATAARLTLMAAYYHPAMAHGRPVSVLVQQGFTYDRHARRRCEIDAVNYMSPPQC